jgi:hypothetical protein
MSPQVVVDEQIDYDKVTALLKRWITAEQIGYEVGHKGFSDERITSLLLRLKRRTLVTIDREFYRRQLRHAGYCLIYFDFRPSQQSQIPILLRRLFQIPGFRTIRERMGKVVKVSATGISYWQLGVQEEQHLDWPSD